MIFDAAAKEKFREILARQCAFSQIELVTFGLMGNHLLDPAQGARSAR